MSIGEIVAAISGGALFLGTFIEVSKIKINPWSSLFGWIGNKMMASVKEEMKELRKEQEEIAKRQEELAIQRAIDAADNIKAEIFNFYNECQRGQRHSEGEFNYIIQQNEKYEELLKVTNDPNGVYEAEYEYILKIYHKCQEEKDFYVGGEPGEAKQEELREHERKLRRIEIQGERKLLEEELKQKREEYWPKKKPPNASKVALAYIFISCTAVQLYSMAAMWHFADLSALYSLIGATVGEAISYCAYAAKATKENTEGGIVHDMAMRGPETCSESQEGPSEAAKG